MRAISNIAKEYLSEEAVKEFKEAEKLSIRERNALRNLMIQSDFSFLMKILLDITNFNGNNYTEDVNTTYHLGGRSSVMYDLLAVFTDIDPTFYPRTLLTLTERENVDRIERTDDTE